MQRILDRFSPDFVAYVNELMRGLRRMQLAPARFGDLYTLRELDLMLIIQGHETQKANEEAEKRWRKNQS